MWFGILTPGVHPSRGGAGSDEATVFCWTPRDRRRIDGPAWAVQGGLRVTRRHLHEAGVPDAAPRCFVCREPMAVPDAAEVRARPGVLRLPEGQAPPPLDPDATEPALLALVHLEDLLGDEDPELDEEALVVVPGQVFALLVELRLLPETLGALRTLTADEPPPTCAGCGVVLPGSARERSRIEGRAARRAALRSGGRHRPRAA